ncbi:MAG: deacylase [Rhodospirillales bacterium]|nr:deacylase [Rhodospirillales bacterium]
MAKKTKVETRISSEVDLEKNGKQQGVLRLPHSVHRSAYGWIGIPVVCIKNGEGPTVLVMSGNHGDEYEGQVTVIKLIRELKPKDVRGRLILLPMANYPAAKAGMRTSPIDQGNMNRTFPGDPHGTPTKAIAHYIECVLLAMCDYVIDLHSGGSSLMILVSSLFKKSHDDKRTARSIELMRVFGAPVGFIDLKDSSGTMSAAALRQGPIHLSTELGGGGTVTVEALRIAEEGTRRVLKHVGALRPNYPVKPGVETRVVTVGGPDYYVHAFDQGLCEPLVELGDEVKKGQPAALIHFPEAPAREPVTARFGRAGLVLCKRMGGRVEIGDCLFHLATDYKV